MLSALLFAPKVAWQNFWRNTGLSLFAVSVMTVVLMMLGVSLVLGHSFNQSLNTIESRATTISVFLADTTPMSNVYNLRQRLAADSRVRSVSYVSKDDALLRYKNDSSIPPDMIKNLEGYNPLPASLDVDMKDVKYVDAIAAEVTGLPLLDATGPTNYRREVIRNLVLFRNFVFILGFALLGGLTAVAIFIIMMSIRTAVYVRRKEIEVMKLVGATDWFVRGPFLLEGVFAGFIAAAIAVGAVAGGYHPFVDYGRAHVSFLPLNYDGAFVGQLILAIGGLGVLLGAFGSYLGVRRFLQT